MLCTAPARTPCVIRAVYMSILPDRCSRFSNNFMFCLSRPSDKEFARFFFISYLLDVHRTLFGPKRKNQRFGYLRESTIYHGMI